MPSRKHSIPFCNFFNGKLQITKRFDFKIIYNLILLLLVGWLALYHLLTLTVNTANSVAVHALNVMNVVEIQALPMAMSHSIGSVGQHYYFVTFVVDRNLTVQQVCNERKTKTIRLVGANLFIFPKSFAKIKIFIYIYSQLNQFLLICEHYL